jgi:hypothetical protein
MQRCIQGIMSGLDLLLPLLRFTPTLPYLTLLYWLLYLTLPYLTLSYLTLPYLTLPYLTLPYLTLPYLTLPYLTIPYHTIPYLTLPYLTLLSLPHLTLPYLTLPYLTLPNLTFYLALPCFILLFVILFRILVRFWHRYIKRGCCWCCKDRKVHSSFEISVEEVIQSELEKPELGDFTISEYNEKGKLLLIIVRYTNLDCTSHCFIQFNALWKIFKCLKRRFSTQQN